MFSTSAPAGTPGAPPADWYLSAPSCENAQRGPALEEVRFFRDEQSDVAWAMEEITESPLGEPWPGTERAPPAAIAPRASGPLTYSIQSPVPAHWFPFIPVQVDPATLQVELAQAKLIYDREPPATRILNPTQAVANPPYRIQDHQLPRAGIALERAVYRARWFDGSTHLWAARAKKIRPPAGASGLRFDLAEPGSNS